MSLSLNLPWSLAQNKWPAELNPILALPILSGLQLKNIVLIDGVNTINTKLQRPLQGWIITDQNAVASIFRSQPLNSTTLTLTSNAAVTVDLWVY